MFRVANYGSKLLLTFFVLNCFRFRASDDSGCSRVKPQKVISPSIFLSDQFYFFVIPITIISKKLENRATIKDLLSFVTWSIFFNISFPFSHFFFFFSTFYEFISFTFIAFNQFISLFLVTPTIGIFYFQCFIFLASL